MVLNEPPHQLEHAVNKLVEAPAPRLVEAPTLIRAHKRLPRNVLAKANEQRKARERRKRFVDSLAGTAGWGRSLNFSLFGDVSQSRAVFQAVASKCITKLSYAKLKGRDRDFYADSSTSVSRLKTEDGVGYFKSPLANYDNDTIEEYGFDPFLAAANELNAYRLAQALGGEYAELVPETSVRSYRRGFGTIQREAPEAEEGSWGRTTHRPAGLFDYLTGNLDRHSGNFLQAEGRVFLIDNGFTFPRDTDENMNMSLFRGNLKERLQPEEHGDFQKARALFLAWKNDGTLHPEAADAAVERVDQALAGEDMS